MKIKPLFLLAITLVLFSCKKDVADKYLPSEKISSGANYSHAERIEPAILDLLKKDLIKAGYKAAAEKIEADYTREGLSKIPAVNGKRTFEDRPIAGFATVLKPIFVPDAGSTVRYYQPGIQWQFMDINLLLNATDIIFGSPTAGTPDFFIGDHSASRAIESIGFPAFTCSNICTDDWNTYTSTRSWLRYAIRTGANGWQPAASAGSLAGTPEQNTAIEAITLNIDGPRILDLGDQVTKGRLFIYYRGYAKGYGWLAWQGEGYPAGTIGENRLLERLSVKIYLVQLN